MTGTTNHPRSKPWTPGSHPPSVPQATHLLSVDLIDASCEWSWAGRGLLCQLLPLSAVLAGSQVLAGVRIAFLPLAAAYFSVWVDHTCCRPAVCEQWAGVVLRLRWLVCDVLHRPRVPVSCDLWGGTAVQMRSRGAGAREQMAQT